MFVYALLIAKIVATGGEPTPPVSAQPVPPQSAATPSPTALPANTPPNSAPAQTPPPASPDSLGAAASQYADRVAPLLPTGANDTDGPVDIVPDAIGLPGTAVSKPAPPPSQPGEPAPAPTPADSTPGDSRGEWLIAPLPNYVPSFGLGIVGRLGYIFPLDPNDSVSPPSIIGAFGYASENGSWAAGMATKLYIDQDRHRVTAALMHGDLNYDFAGIGTAAGQRDRSIPLSQEMTGGLAEWLFKVGPGVYLGPRYIGATLDISTDQADLSSPVTPPERQLDSTLSGLGLHAQWDTRDSQFYPRQGHLADIEATFHDPAWGDSFSYQVYELSYNQYISFAPNQVLAMRVKGQFENGDVPFYALSQFGRGSDLRGYELGRYQDKQLIAAQAEYRVEFTKRLGAVAFAGLGEVSPSLSEFNFEDLLPSAGVGLRFVVAEKNHIAFRFDVAWGRDSDGPVFYLTVGEAF